MEKSRVGRKETTFTESYPSHFEEIIRGMSGIPKFKRFIPGIYRGGFTHEDYWPYTPTETAIVDVSDELSVIREDVDNLSKDVGDLRNEVLSCKNCINKLSEELSERPIIKQTWLLDIAEDIEVLQPIPIVIEESEEEVVVSFGEVEVFATASNESEAINNIKLEIRDLFIELEESNKEELGKLPRAWKRTMEKVVRRIGRS